MALMDFEPVEQHSILCTHASGCTEQAAVSWTGQASPRPGRFVPLCFRHAFIEALANDSQAQRLAVGYAVAEGLRAGRGVAS